MSWVISNEYMVKSSSGGKCLSVEYIDEVGELAKKYDLKLHIDGARIFNASIVSALYLYISTQY